MYLWECKYLKDTVDTSTTVCDEIINDTNNVFNTSMWQILFQQIWQILYQKMSQVIRQQILMVKKVRYKIDCYILHIVLLVVILLFIMLLLAIIMQNIGQKKKCIAVLI